MVVRFFWDTETGKVSRRLVDWGYVLMGFSPEEKAGWRNQGSQSIPCGPCQAPGNSAVHPWKEEPVVYICVLSPNGKFLVVWTGGSFNVTLMLLRRNCQQLRCRRIRELPPWLAARQQNICFFPQVRIVVCFVTLPGKLVRKFELCLQRNCPRIPFVPFRQMELQLQWGIRKATSSYTTLKAGSDDSERTPGRVHSLWWSTDDPTSIEMYAGAYIWRISSGELLEVTNVTGITNRRTASC
jgi:hypothetical protein